LVQEACFRDVVVLYRRAVDKKHAAGEMDIITNMDPVRPTGVWVFSIWSCLADAGRL
jgi:hypothetical protein